MKPTGQEMLLLERQFVPNRSQVEGHAIQGHKESTRDGQVAEGAREKCGSARGNRQGKVSRLSIGSSERFHQALWFRGCFGFLLSGSGVIRTGD